MLLLKKFTNLSGYAELESAFTFMTKKPLIQLVNNP